ncbi:MAG: DNA-directed RNA polymerase subunit beta', partial [Patescibacteria group bacterium]
HTIKVWTEAKSKITVAMIAGIKEENDIHYMIDSGARGNWGQITQLCGMKGLVANPAGRTIELPIKSNLKEGFNILEYFIATHGGRKGKSDTALKTAEAGYLTRRLVDAVQDIIIKEEDCGTEEFHSITFEESREISETVSHRITGRIAARDIADPKTGELIVQRGHQITNELAKTIEVQHVDGVPIRSVMTCISENGICRMCYGRDLGTNELVDIGTAVGIIAAQSIGEPGTQLTMRTFHMGGVADESDITAGLTRVEELFEARTPKSPSILSEIEGTVKITRQGNQTNVSIASDGPVETIYVLPPDFEVAVKEGEKLRDKQVIGKSTTSKNTIRTEDRGTVENIEGNVITIKSSGPVEKTYNVPFGKTLKVKNSQRVKRGDAVSSGHFNLRELLRLTDLYNVKKYIIKEVQSIYASQGQSINDKHLEIIARQMLSKVRILDPGEGMFLPGETVNNITFERSNRELKKARKKPIHAERLLLGLTRVSLYTDSWLSAASFQETIRVLVEAATTKRIDNLVGLKENVIIGKLIPAGRTFKKKYDILHAN